MFTGHLWVLGKNLRNIIHNLYLNLIEKSSLNQLTFTIDEHWPLDVHLTSDFYEPGVKPLNLEFASWN